MGVSLVHSEVHQSAEDVEEEPPQDQAILSVLMHSAKVEKSCIGGHDTDVLIHNDCKGVTCGLLREFVVTSINQKYRVSIPLSPDC